MARRCWSAGATCSRDRSASTLLAVPNVCEGSRLQVIEELARAFAAAGAARVLDVHADPDHNRSVYTLAARPRDLAGALLTGARAALDAVDLRSFSGLHPHVGVLDVAPVVWLSEAQRGAAIAEALVLGDRLGEELGLPVFLYGELGAGRTRAWLRRGGPGELARRVRSGELRPDFGPAAIDPRRGVTLVAARAPLVAFNLELAPPAGLEQARRVAAVIREGGDQGLPGVRAIGLWLGARAVAQVSTNIEDLARATPADVLAAVARHASVAAAELVGLAPRSAFEAFPLDEIPVRGLRALEDALTSLDQPT
jgi:glutamate formiminotransferase